jgi:hypothetical protein
VGAPLHEFRGVLTGVPEYAGGAAPLMAVADAPAASSDGG